MKNQQIRVHNNWPSRSAVALCAIVAAVGPFARFADAAPAIAPALWRTDSLRPTDIWNTLTLQMSVSRWRISSTGARSGSPSPATTYRIERSSRTGSWKTVITVVGVDGGPAYSLAGALIPRPPFPVSRIEDDEDGRPARVYDAAGRRLMTAAPKALAVAALLPRSSGQAWLEAFVASAALKSRRLEEFERQFGKGAQAGALTRFLRKDLDTSQEVIVDSESAVPLESKAMRGGRITSRRTFGYAPAPDGAVVRTFVHSETLVSPDTGDVALADTAISDIRLELRR